MQICITWYVSWNNMVAMEHCIIKGKFVLYQDQRNKSNEIMLVLRRNLYTYCNLPEHISFISTVTWNCFLHVILPMQYGHYYIGHASVIVAIAHQELYIYYITVCMFLQAMFCFLVFMLLAMIQCWRYYKQRLQFYEPSK